MRASGRKRVENRGTAGDRSPARDALYAALNDPDILEQCISGCKEFTRHSDTAFEAVISLKFGPVKVTFKSAVILTNLEPPESYTLLGEARAMRPGSPRAARMCA